MEFLKTTYHQATNSLVQFVKYNQTRRDHGSSRLIVLQQTDTRINQPIKTKIWLMFIILTLVLNSTQVFADNTKSTDELEINSLLQAPISGNSVSLETTPTINAVIASGQLDGPLYPSLPIKEKLGTVDLQKSITLSDVDKLENYDLQNRQFAEAMNVWNNHDYNQAVELMKEYVAQHADGLWTGEALLHQAYEARYNGRYSEANAIYRKVIDQYENKNFAGAKLLLDKARSRLAVMEMMRNNIESALEIFSQLVDQSPDWRIRTYASSWIRDISAFRKDNIALADCGTQALAQILRMSGQPDSAKRVLSKKPKTMDGFSLAELTEMAAEYDLPVTAILLESVEQLADIALPAIARISTTENAGHYWLIESKQDNQLTLYDAQAKRRFKQSLVEFSKEWQGHLLVFSDEIHSGEQLTSTQAQSVYGACCGLRHPESFLGEGESMCGAPGGNDSDNDYLGDTSAAGEPVWGVNPLNMNFYMTDIPLWYKPAYGPTVAVRLAYNSQSSIDFRTEVGNKWQMNFASYLVVDPGSAVTVFMPSGRRDVYIENSNGYSARDDSDLVLSKQGEAHFQLQWRDGTIWEYTSPANTQQIYLSAIKDTDNHALNITYNADKIDYVQDAQGRKLNFIYGVNDKITHIEDPFERSIQFTYNNEGDLLSIEDMGGYVTAFEYDDNKNIRLISTDHGSWQILIEPSDGDSSAPEGYPASGGPMWVNYRITITNPDGRKQEYYWDESTISSWYVGPDHYVEYVDKNTNNAQSTVAKIIYERKMANGQARLARIKYPNAGDISYNYAFDGRLVEIINNDVKEARYVWDNKNRLVEQLSSYGTSIQYSYNDHYDITQIRNNFNTIDVIYNENRLPITIIDSLFGSVNYQYNSHGKLTNAVYSTGENYFLDYDTQNRLTSIDLNNNRLISYAYDNKDRINTITDSADRIYTISYDDLNRPLVYTYPDGKTAELSYGNAPEIITQLNDRTDRNWQFEHDIARRLTKMTKPGEKEINYTYHDNGDITLINERGKPIGFGFNEDGQLNRLTDPNNHSEIRGYNAGKVSNISDARNLNQQIDYDHATGLLTTVQYADYANSNYYPSRKTNRFTRDSWGRIIQIEDEIGITEITYDAKSRISTIDGPWQDDTITYAYDDQSRIVDVNLQKSEIVNYSYDESNRLKTIKRGNQDAYEIRYRNPTSEITTLVYPNQQRREYKYDELGRLVGVSNKDQLDNVLAKFGYRYDEFDKINQIKTQGLPSQSITPVSRNALYDDADQLYNFSTESIKYDASGNAIDSLLANGTHYTAQYDAANRLATLTYENDGNEYNINFKYGWHDLVGAIEYYIDTKIDGDYTDNDLVFEYRFIRELSSLDVLQRRDKDNNVIDNFIWLPAYLRTLDRLVEVYSDPTNPQYQFHDGHGNIVARTNSANDILGKYVYDPYGNLIAEEGNAPATDYGYQSKFKEPWTNWIDFGYRFYDSDKGRWINRDPIRYGDGTNRYAYNRGDPINYVDLDGLEVRINTRYLDIPKFPYAGRVGAHSMTNVNNSSVNVTYSSHNDNGINNVWRDHRTDVGPRSLPLTSSIVIPPPAGMTQQEWDDAVIREGEIRVINQNHNYGLFGGDGGIRSGNCHTTTRNIITSAGGSIPSDYSPPGLHPGLHPNTPPKGHPGY